MFEYESRAGYDHMLVLNTTSGATIKIGFNGFEAETVYFGENENGFDVSGVDFDNIKGLHVDFGTTKALWLSMEKIVFCANCMIKDIVAEVKQEEADEKAHENEMMSQERYI